MILVFLLAAQAFDPQPLDLDLRPPHGAEVKAAERRSRKQVPTIVRLCRDALRSGDLDEYVKHFADRNGLSSYGRVTLAMNCLIYRQGTKDGTR